MIPESPYGADRPTLMRLVDDAEEVRLGRVEATEIGFSFGLPGTLLVVSIDKPLSTMAVQDSPARLLLFYSEAHFAIGSRRFCQTGWFPDGPPRPGDTVLFLRTTRPRDSEGSLFFTQWYSVPVVERADGTIEVASEVMLPQECANRPLSQLVQQLASHPTSPSEDLQYQRQERQR